MRKTLCIVIAAILGALGCSSDPNDRLFGQHGGFATGSGSLAAGESNTFDHQASAMGADNGYTDPVAKQAMDGAMGTPDQVARMHGAQKISYATLGTILTGIGVNVANKTAGSAGALYAGGSSALGAPLFSSRVPEQSFPSTSSLAKQFDIFSAGATEILANMTNSKRCTGAALVTNGQFTKDGLSCLMGKPATDQHVALANQAITAASDATTGNQIAVATLLSAAHISE